MTWSFTFRKSLRRAATMFALSGLLLSATEAQSGTSKVRLMLRHAWLIGLGVFLALIGILGAVAYFSVEPKPLRTAFDQASTEDAALVQSVTRALAREHARIRLRAVPVAGVADPAKAIDQNRADVAIVRGDLGLPKDGLPVAIVRHDVLLLMVPAPGSSAVQGRTGKARRNVDSIDELAGKRIGVIGPLQDYATVLDAIFKQYGIAADKVTLIPLDAADLATSLHEHPIDVLAAIGPIDRSDMARAVAAASTAKHPPAFLGIDANDAMAERWPNLESAEIKAGAFEGTPLRPDDTLETIGYARYVVARRKLSETVVGNLTRRLLDDRQQLAQEFPGSVKIQAPDASKDADIVVHPGAAAYLNDNQRTFFDRYDDFIYLGLMLLSFIGSVAAWFVSYVRARVGANRAAVVARVQDMIRQARTASTADELDRLTAESDEILDKAVTRASRNSDEGLETLGMAMDHLRHAITERRTMLSPRLAMPRAS